MGCGTVVWQGTACTGNFVCERAEQALTATGRTMKHAERMAIPSGGLRIAAGVLMLMIAWASAAAAAQTVYRSVDENGVVSFSDVASNGAERLELSPVPVREDAQIEQQALIEQQLTVARSLEESRLAREEARTKRLQALAAAQPRTVYYREADQYRYPGGQWRYWDGGHGPWFPHRPPPHRPDWPGHPGSPTQPIEPPPAVHPPGRPVPFPTQNGPGG